MKVEFGIYAILYCSFMTFNMHFKILLSYENIILNNLIIGSIIVTSLLLYCEDNRMKHLLLY